jgi:hypothetical protein
MSETPLPRDVNVFVKDGPHQRPGKMPDLTAKWREANAREQSEAVAALCKAARALLERYLELAGCETPECIAMRDAIAHAEQIRFGGGQ